MDWIGALSNWFGMTTTFAREIRMNVLTPHFARGGMHSPERDRGTERGQVRKHSTIPSLPFSSQDLDHANIPVQCVFQAFGPGTQTTGWPCEIQPPYLPRHRVVP